MASGRGLVRVGCPRGVDDRAGLRVLEGDCVSGDQELNKETGAARRWRTYLVNSSGRLALVSLDDAQPFRAYWPVCLAPEDVGLVHDGEGIWQLPARPAVPADSLEAS
jgi:hypothetical protein